MRCGPALLSFGVWISTTACIAAEPGRADDSEQQPAKAGDLKFTRAPKVALDAGTSDAFDRQWVACPSVLREGRTLRMYYSSWFDANQGPGGIGLATSADGLTWQRHDDGRPLLSLGMAGAFDDGQVMGPEVRSDDGKYLMWYTGMSSRRHASGFGHYRIGLATSADGVRWERANAGKPVLDLGPAGSPGEVQVATPSIVREASGYRMWYAAWSPRHNHTICVAESKDGLAWQRVAQGQPVTGLSPSIAFGHAVARCGERYLMLYMALKAAPGLYAATSADGLNWTMLNDGKPVIVPGESGRFDSALVGHPFILCEGAQHHIWYTGYQYVGEGRRSLQLRIGSGELILPQS